ncbi:DUF5681 domain-containing protein [Rhizobium sp. 32-5/1]|uniref:DUF5681 domain-containing protein n=1 Tax=Rhizobium sp. 32-5/1 TaxID=3019602 RepID=UPI00240D212A|nr:DUF5681 domain-containing protein [Rhizobium sp. 32-5/1]WEZ84640.1 DUF5681 domain-containing protein [Rhizobium sp. 32-5/1]
MTTEKETPRDTRFKPGQSGNPNGRTAGSRSKVLLALDVLGEGEAEAIVLAMVEKAKEGDSTAARTILDRVWPIRKGARVPFDLPTVTTADDLPGAVAAITRQVADGELSPDEGAAVVTLVEAHRKAIETHDLAARIAALEERMSTK